MAFLLRTVSRSAEGREIVRTARVEGDRLTIGRDPGSGVHLTDLAASLAHATVERIAPGRLEIVAAPGLFVELNGRKVERGTIETAAGGDVRIGAHLLRFLPGPPNADIEVAIERVRDDEKTSRADAAQFSLASRLPGKRPLAWGLALLVLALFLAWPIWSFYDQKEERSAERFHADRLWLSGSLSAVHANLRDNCTACHAEPFVSVRDESCKTCHSDVHDHGDPARLVRARPDLGTWGRLRLAVQETFNLPAGRCVDCHSEHEGPQEMALTPQRFCADCHSGIAERVPEAGLGDASDFGRVHPEFRPTVLISWNGETPVMRRVAPGAAARENSNLRFPHALHLDPRGGPAQMGRRLGPQYGFGASLVCADCHVPTPNGTRFQPVDMEADCGMCHSLAFDEVGGTVRTLRHGAPEQVVADLREYFRGRVPARPDVLVPGARRRPGDVNQIRNTIQYAVAVRGSESAADRAIRGLFAQGGACWDCHVVLPPPGNSLAFRIAPVAFPTRYMHNGWFDHAPHRQTDCATCHAAPSSRSANDLLLPDLASCRTCHGGESSGQVPSTCAMCHDYHMDEGVPAMLLRQRVRGRRWETIAIPVGADRREGGRR